MKEIKIVLTDILYVCICYIKMLDDFFLMKINIITRRRRIYKTQRTYSTGRREHIIRVQTSTLIKRVNRSTDYGVA